MVECEYTSNENAIGWSRVLIDTWWNVNLENIVSLYVTNVVLIDTWWNVNFDRIMNMKSSIHGFNRYMVECEYKQTRRRC